MVILTDPESENLKSENAVLAKVHQMDTRGTLTLSVGAKNEETKQTTESCSQMGKGGEMITKAAFCLKKQQKKQQFSNRHFSPQLFEWPVENV